MESEGPAAVAARLDADIDALPVKKTAAFRTVRRRYSRELADAEPALILALAHELIDNYRRRWIAYELVREHDATFQQLNREQLEALGGGIHSWSTVDSFGRTLSGPAWLAGNISDDVIRTWAHSDDLWWRRAALVSTVALNTRSRGGYGDVERTLAVCRLLVDDHEDMVVKALSWALRALSVHEPDAVWTFLGEHEDELAARVKREVRNKLTTGLKNPRKNPRKKAA